MKILNILKFKHDLLSMIWFSIEILKPWSWGQNTGTFSMSFLEMHIIDPTLIYGIRITVLVDAKLNDKKWFIIMLLSFVVVVVEVIFL